MVSVGEALSSASSTKRYSPSSATLSVRLASTPCMKPWNGASTATVAALALAAPRLTVAQSEDATLNR